MPTKKSVNVGKFGKIALELGLVDINQIQECLAIQMDYERSGRDIPKLGTILLAKGYLNSRQVKEILDQQKVIQQNASENNASGLLQEYAAGTVIFREGDHSDQDMFLVQQGAVELCKRGVHLLERCGDGAFFGITSCLLKTPRNATAIAKTACKIYRIPAQKAQDFFQAKPAMAVKLATLLAENLFALKNKFVESQLTLRQARKIPSQPPVTKNIVPKGVSVFDLPTTGADLPVFMPGLTEATPIRINPPVRAPLPSAQKTMPAASHSSGTAAIVNNAPDEKTCRLAKEDSRQNELTNPQPTAPAQILLTDTFPETELNQAPKMPLSLAANEDKTDELPTPPEARVDEKPDELAEVLSEETAAPTVDIPEDEKDIEPAPAEMLYIDSTAPAVPQPTGPDLTTLMPDELPAIVAELQAAPFPRQIKELVQIRVNFFMEVEKLEELRGQMEQEHPDNLPESVKSELARQRREVAHIPPFEALNTGLEKLKEMLKAPPEGKNDPLLPKTLEWARQQKKIFLMRSRMTLQLLRVCAQYATGEPLYGILLRHGISGENLFGWGVYGWALRSFAEDQTEHLKFVRVELQATKTEDKGKGFLGFGRKNRDEIAAKRQLLEEDEKRTRLLITSTNRELAAIEKQMVDAFWSIYTEAGLLLVKGVSAGEEPFLRGLLRWGVLGYSPRWLSEGLAAKLLEDCAQSPVPPIFDMKQTHIYYADELVVLTARGQLPPTSNEDLELNQRNSPLWKADRAWRRIINCRMQEGIFRDILAHLQKETEMIRMEQQDKERELLHAQGRANDKDKKNIISQLRHHVQNCKVKAGRLERICEKISDERLPRNQEEREQAQRTIEDTGINFTPADLAGHELRCLRRNARLVAKLKEPFLPFTLTERFKPEIGCVNDRAMVLHSLEDAQMRDSLLFSEPLIPSAKRVHRILMRVSPIIVIAPAGGILGFMLGARMGMECGRLVLPAYVERANLREEVLWNLLSDFRYDTSKASAGVDLLNSETLVAAYSQVRWNLRKRDRELRQKAGIYMEENERTNWRRHYTLYMKSALDCGKLLFFKCPELYELIINRYIDLPGGCELLRR